MESALGMMERASTGLDGLDDILKGGLPRGWLHLVQGKPGTGKTTLALHFLLHGVERGETTLLVSLSEVENEIRAMARSHGWSLDGVRLYELGAAENVLGLTPRQTIFHPSEVELAEVSGTLLNLLEEMQPLRVVIDSVAEFRLLAGTSAAYRQQILLLKRFVSRTDCTMLLVDSTRPDPGNLELQTLVNTVIAMRKEVPEFGTVRRRLQVLKTRGIPFRSGYHDFRIEAGGLRVFPRLVAAEHRGRFPAEQIPSGVRELDSLLGGGLDRGTSTLLLGPSGIGKTSIAVQYACAAAARGERALMYIFEERPPTLYHRAEQMGMDLRRHVNAGRIDVREIDPSELSPGELMHQIRSEVANGTRMLVMDSLNGYLRATLNEDFLTLQLRELLTYVGHHAVATVLVFGQRGLFTPPKPMIDLTYLTDTVLLFRYFEFAGEVRKALSVFKRRGGAHERTIRELRLSSAGVQVGEPLTGFRGVLTGVPVRMDHEAGS